MLPLDAVLPNLVHLGAMLYLICFLFRDQINLRCFAIAGDLAYTGFYFGAADVPLWSAIFWSGLNVVINVIMIGLILRENRMSHFDDNELTLFRNLRGLTPGQFRKLLKLGTWGRAKVREQLAEEGQPLDRLHYVLDGGIEISKAGRIITADPAIFIGELAFLRDKPATATVHVAPGALYVSWPRAALNAALAKDEALRNALGALINTDLAEKVANA